MVLAVKKTFKYRIYPTKAQASRLQNTFSMCRHLYNWSLKERQEAWETDRRRVTYYDQANLLPGLKKDRPWFKSVHSQVLQDVLRRLDKAYKSFFRRVAAGEKPGFPKFKKRGRWTSITYPQYSQAPAEIIQVPKVGEIRLVLHRQVPEQARIKTLTLSREGGRWFACFSCELELDVELKQDHDYSLGIDLGLIDLFYASDGSHVPAPRHLKVKEKQLQRLQRRRSRTKKGSNEWRRLGQAISKCHHRIACRRSDFLHKAANDLLAKADFIAHEDLRIKTMCRRPAPMPAEVPGDFLPNGAGRQARLNKSIMDASWGHFLDILQYKALEQGKQVVAVNPMYTSQACSQCGQIIKKSLSTRTHRCDCGLVLPRDHNAAINILRVGLHALAAKAA